MRLTIGETYRHFKGHIVTVTDIAKHTETGETLIIYYHHETGEAYARPSQMFCGKVDKEKYPNADQEYRFENETN